MLPVFTLSAALAGTPTFVSNTAVIPPIAARLWEAGVACTGWSPRAHDVVEIRDDGTHGSAGGRAYRDEGGLYRIEVDYLSDSTTLDHEIAHAWVRANPGGPREGLTDLLADCISARARGPGGLLGADDGSALADLPDLRVWSPDLSGPTASDADLDGYTGSARLIRGLAAAIPFRVLFPEGGEQTWGALLALAAGTPAYRPLEWFLGQEVAGQSAALNDPDYDGLSCFEEWIVGTDPHMRDTDGDGWWDGQAPIPGALPLPYHPAKRCSAPTAAVLGYSRLPPSWRAQVAFRLGSGGWESPREGGAAPIFIAESSTVYGVSGGAWLEGASHAACVNTGSMSAILQAPGHREAALALSEALEALPIEPGYSREQLALPVAVVLGGGQGIVAGRGGIIHVSEAHLALAEQEGASSYLAGLVLGLHLREQMELDVSEEHIEAAARTVSPYRPRVPWVGVEEERVHQILAAAAAACPTPWVQILHGGCEVPPVRRQHARPACPSWP